VVESKNQALLQQAAVVLRSEAAAILEAADMLDESFCKAIKLLENCTGSVVVTGMGKAGLIGRKISATLASTGTPSHFLHPAEAMHGDLGVLRNDDLMLAISQSGETTELTQILPHVKSREIPIIALTSQRNSTLGQFASLGMRLLKVEEKMRPVECCRLARPEDTVREVFARPLPSRRTGAVMIVTAEDHLVGIFTDSDLARLFENRQDDALDRPIREVMTSDPISVPEGTRLEDAVSLLDRRRLSELPVVDTSGCPSGLLDVVDLVGADLSANSKNPNHPENKQRKHSSAA